MDKEKVMRLLQETYKEIGEKSVTLEQEEKIVPILEALLHAVKDDRLGPHYDGCVLCES